MASCVPWIDKLPIDYLLFLIIRVQEALISPVNTDIIGITGAIGVMTGDFISA